MSNDVNSLFLFTVGERQTDRKFKIQGLTPFPTRPDPFSYVGKNLLNRFRQEHGYKEGTYTKVWNGREDNVVMQEILSARPGIDPEELYAKLEAEYPG